MPCTSEFAHLEHQSLPRARGESPKARFSTDLILWAQVTGFGPSCGFTFGRACWRTSRRSYCACRLTQICGSVPKTPASRTAMSGVIGARPLTTADTCLRVTPPRHDASGRVPSQCQLHVQSPSVPRLRVELLALLGCLMQQPLGRAAPCSTRVPREDTSLCQRPG